MCACHNTERVSVKIALRYLKLTKPTVHHNIISSTYYALLYLICSQSFPTITIKTMGTNWPVC